MLHTGSKTRYLFLHRIYLIGVLCLFYFLPTVTFALQFSAIDSLTIDTTAIDSTIKKDFVYLLHADVTKYNKKINPDAQILVGNVVFRHDSMYMYCDSAYFYDATNSLEAFDNVRMEQGDTLFLYGDYLDYNGNTMLARVRNNVRLENNNAVLVTDSLDYDRVWSLGYFFDGGKLYDEENVLTSDWGEYNTNTNDAVFNFEVKLVNPQFTLTSDTLNYNTQTKIAHITGPSNIVSDENHIYSELGFYNTTLGQVILLNRSIISNNGKKLVADSIFYDRQNGFAEAFEKMIYVDEVENNMLTGNYGYYNELLDSAFATKQAVAMEFSQGDTLFIHGDTLRLITIHNYIPYNDSLQIDSIPNDSVVMDSAYRQVRAYYKVRMYRSDIQAVCDSLVFDSRDSCLTMYNNPILWNGGQQLLGEVIKIYMDSNAIDWMHVINQTLFVQQKDSVHYNQIAGTEMKYYFVDGDIRQADVIGNVLVIFYPEDDDSVMIGMNTTEASQLMAYMVDRQIDKIVIPSQASGVVYPMTQIPADKMFLSNFAWFNYIRPLNKEDIFIWRGKNSADELKIVERKPVPLPMLENVKKKEK